jgi:hypothetical protein
MVITPVTVSSVQVADSPQLPVTVSANATGMHDKRMAILRITPQNLFIQQTLSLDEFTCIYHHYSGNNPIFQLSIRKRADIFRSNIIEKEPVKTIVFS